MGILRIVKMEFQRDQLDNFDDLFAANETAISGMSGCRGVKLFKGTDTPSIRTTLSWWDSEEDLKRYRQSEVFGRVWPKTKSMFAAPPIAWSLEWPSEWPAFSEKDL